MINFFKKISSITWLVWFLVITSLGLVYYADYENNKWWVNLDSINQKYVPVIRVIRENIPWWQIIVSWETVDFYLVTQKEIDAIEISNNTGFTLGTNYKPTVDIKNFHKNNNVGIWPKVCYSWFYQEYPSTTIYKNNQKIILSANRHEEAINQYCKEHWIFQEMQRTKVIQNLQNLRDSIEKNDIEVMNAIDSMSPSKKKLLDILNNHFFDSTEIQKLIMLWMFLMIIVEIFAFFVRFIKRDRIQ